MRGDQQRDEQGRVLDPEPDEVNGQEQHAVALPVRVREPPSLEAVTIQAGAAGAVAVVGVWPHPDQDGDREHQRGNEKRHPLAPPVEGGPERAEDDHRAIRVHVESRHHTRDHSRE